jgi:NTP pyrophosphatase (non-canonical NTP hydrolase)
MAKTRPSPFGKYFRKLDDIDKDMKNNQEFGSILILSLVEELGEMARAYLAKHGRKPSNVAAQQDETYQQELGDILVTIIRFARIKNINLDQRIMYTLRKIERRKTKPKTIAVDPYNNIDK